MADLKLAYGSRTQITCTLDSLTSSTTAGRQSAAVDNTTNKYLDAIVDIKIVYPNSAPANAQVVYVFAFGGDGTNYDGYAGASDAAYTFDAITTVGQNLPSLGAITMIQNKTQIRKFSVASAFGGVLPPYWGLVFLNYSGQTLSSGCTVHYTGIYSTVA